MKDTLKNTLMTGFAMFSMFFGAGNVVFPLAIGQYAKDQNLFALLGLLITTVLLPFLGLLGMTLYDGNYTRFFERIGKVPGFILALIIMGLLGPLGAIPRCIALSYSAMLPFFNDLSLPFFSFLACILIFLLSFRRNNLLDVLGIFLTPALLISLAIIILAGLINRPPLPLSLEPSFDVFLKGLKEGYQTMDLLGAFFFSSVVVICLRKEMGGDQSGNMKKIINLTLRASFIAASLLALIYTGFSFVSAFHSNQLGDISKDVLLSTISLNILGSHAAIIPLTAVALACLTTAIALSAVSAEFIQKNLFAEKINFITSLLLTLLISFAVSTLNFTGIVEMLEPILFIFYPALMVLTAVNILYQLYRFEPVKIPVYGTFALTLLFMAREPLKNLFKAFNS